MPHVPALSIALLALLAQSPVESRPAADKGAAEWTSLFNGRDLTGWYTFLQRHGRNHDPDRVISIEDGAIHLYKDAAEGSAVVMGYIGTEKEYGDYHLRFQYRWGEKKFQPRYALKRDAGFYYHITGPDAVWPRSLQFQIEQTNVGDLIALYGMHLDTWADPTTLRDDQPTFLPPEDGGRPRVMGGKGISYQRRLKDAKELPGWNTVDVIARGDSTVHLLNGQEVNRGSGIRFVDPEKGGPPRPLTRGRIALEIEAAEIYFRNIEITPLTGSSTR
ncbi:MAG: DUF1080 domain-containing protein [Isosphaeraceae bacterium]